MSKDSEYYAHIQVKRFFEAVKVLEKYPLSGKMVPEKLDPEIREVFSGSYRLIYRIVSDKRVDIITVHHNRRLLANNPAIK
ncbi:type II toxin-antitoxin system RelE/ParE family toxin [Mucilaginibacter rigui]|uniref:type II toxin-antitoxin system RelE/ParE family toxin n=1 Tax=Mucilaginibacter rigui TaxID=534635 RepID=UPI003742CD60